MECWSSAPKESSTKNWAIRHTKHTMQKRHMPRKKQSIGAWPWPSYSCSKKEKNDWALHLALVNFSLSVYNEIFAKFDNAFTNLFLKKNSTPPQSKRILWVTNHDPYFSKIKIKNSIFSLITPITKKKKSILIFPK